MNTRDLVELLRAPAALTVPGDALAGGATGAAPLVSAVCLYWAGMALNDYADRVVDAEERPERPIPSGRVRPRQALAIASGLTGAGLAVAALSGRRQVLATAVPLAAVVWAYDLKLKDTTAGPAAMAAARGLDVLLGGRPGAPQAAVSVAAHTYGVALLSRGEVTGGRSSAAVTALASTAVATAVAAGALFRSDRRTSSLVPLAAYSLAVGRAQSRAVRSPDAYTIRTAVSAGILGLPLLQAALIAARGRPFHAMAMAATWPLARLLTRKVSPT
ncbi:SCO3242 family prenyltransferase [Actinomadura rudentiformis]|uniref:4-hydroxybenzoate polyprenyltransferase n=1 Tax=Actinomadura rudentiformis TaxID=359158 RepID=A0A6H9YUZ3_9ACTN|nr:UbiA family prenyltransferase [Actinomadura rudentiformis]KAB2352437.1 4-hydroxybenzoate polyprenyltransferase [Actinomadura rudentiformis]